MTHKSWNMGGNDSASGDVRRLSPLLLLTLVLLGSRTPACAADPLEGPFLFTSSNRTMKDLEIETKVRRALREDAQLKPLNLGVHVAGGIARLSGPVPSQELKQRAIRIVEHVEGVLKVNAGDLYLSTAAQGPKRMSVLIEDEQPTQTRSASSPSPSSGMGPLTRSGETTVSPVPGPDRRDTGPTGQQVTLLAPELAPRPARAPDATQLTANPRPASPAVSIAEAIGQLRHRQARFQQIRTQVQGTTVYIFPGEAAGENAMMFAQAVRRLPGVQHVIVAPGSR
jgi:hypothetical protein